MRTVSLLYLLTLSVAPELLAKTNQPHPKKIIRTLIVDGQNNHEQWPKITYMMKQYF